jgi:hypothetical protein
MQRSDILAHSLGGSSENPHLVLNFEALATLRGEIINTTKFSSSAFHNNLFFLTEFTDLCSAVRT